MTSVLVVDDNLDVHLLARRVLEDRADVTCASRLAEARRLLVENRYDVVFLDLLLPDGSGLDLLRDLKATWPGQKVVIVSGATTVAVGREAIELGADAVMDKTEPVFRLLEFLGDAP
jgi:two-component system phosphate regulon response regulator OmpR